MAKYNIQGVQQNDLSNKITFFITNILIILTLTSRYSKYSIYIIFFLILKIKF